MITKLLASAAIVLGAAVGAAAPASADPTPTPNPNPSAHVNPFIGILCAPGPNCQQGMPSQAPNPQLTQAIQQGISDAVLSQQ